jgi:predicted dehydrogenase
MNQKKINIAIVGLGFGAEFIPIYQKHSYAKMYAVCQRDRQKLDEISKAFGIEKKYTDYGELLKDPEIDAVHINTPIQNHAKQTIAALRAGKHVACTVPMATTVDECREIVETVKETGLTYMMMETVVYSREFLYVKELYAKGELGKIQFLRASHQQEMSGWPGYWEGLPPMHYATHCVGPVLALTQAEAEYVSCFGSGTIDEHLIAKYGSPFAVESCHARQYRESFDVYGSKKSFEWTLTEHEDNIIHTGEIPSKVKIPDYAYLLPPEIQAFTTAGVYDSNDNQHLSFIQGSGHGGSHPHMVNEFLNALVHKRSPYPNATQAANITCVGILAHDSAMQGGIIKQLPAFTFSGVTDKEKMISA